MITNHSFTNSNNNNNNSNNDSGEAPSSARVVLL